jgi:hypothetical protein
MQTILIPASPGPLKHWNRCCEFFRCSLVGKQKAKLIRYCEIFHYASKDEKLTAYFFFFFAATSEQSDRFIILDSPHTGSVAYKPPLNAVVIEK